MLRKMMSKNIDKVSRDTQSLQARIQMNQGNQVFDLEGWIFGSLRERKYERILELCAGTGRQSEYLLSLLRKDGQLVLLDASSASCQLLTERFKALPLVSVVNSDLDEYLAGCGKKFDFIFVSYGLYYSKLAEKELSQRLMSLLLPNGELLVIGPHRGNNEELFSSLSSCGVRIPDSVVYCCEHFMDNLLLAMKPYGGSANVELASNPQSWRSAANLLKYWESSTFYNVSKREAVAQYFKEWFSKEKEFVVTKRIAKIIFKKRTIHDT